jgi:hypothetical protein
VLTALIALRWRSLGWHRGTPAVERAAVVGALSNLFNRMDGIHSGSLEGIVR